MRILLVNPPNSGRSIPEERYGISSLKQIFRGEPLGLETLAGNLDSHSLRILDLKIEPDGLVSELERFSPDLVAFTAMTCEANAVVRLAATVKECARARVVVGGVHASCDPEFFNQANFDWIVVGLGKQSLRELVDALEGEQSTENIPGVAPVRPGQPLVWQPRNFDRRDLVADCSPRYDLVEQYRPHYHLQTLGLQMGLVASAAGCPYDCSFCSIAPLTRGHYISASVDTVVRDIHCLDQTPVIRLVDANTFGSPQHARLLADAIAKSGLRKQFLADVRADTVVRHPELMRLWQEIGLRAVIIGFEEIDDGALGAMNKECSATLNREAIAILHDLGLTIVGDFIVSPDYDEVQFDRLADFVRQEQIELPMFTVMTPLPGTRLYQELQSRICIHDLDFYTLTNSVLPTYLDEELFYQRYAALLQDGHHKARV